MIRDDRRGAETSGDERRGADTPGYVPLRHEMSPCVRKGDTRRHPTRPVGNFSHRRCNIFDFPEIAITANLQNGRIWKSNLVVPGYVI
jgi:hypothetical protein